MLAPGITNDTYIVLFQIFVPIKDSNTEESNIKK